MITIRSIHIVCCNIIFCSKLIVVSPRLSRLSLVNDPIFPKIHINYIFHPNLLHGSTLYSSESSQQAFGSGKIVFLCVNGRLSWIDERVFALHVLINWHINESLHAWHNLNVLHTHVNLNGEGLRIYIHTVVRVCWYADTH